MPTPQRFAPLAVPSFRLFAASRFFSGVGMTLLRMQILWHVYEISGSAFHLGLVGLVQFLPALGLSLVGGAVADSYERRKVAMLAEAVSLGATAVLYVATSAGNDSLALIYALVFVTAVAGAFENPARTALLPSLVPRELFPASVTLYTGVQMIAFMSGPALQGVIVATAGRGAAYAVHFGLGLFALGGLALLAPRPLEGPPQRVSWAAIAEGLAYVRNNQVVLGCMSLDMFAVLFGGAVALLPIYAKDILGAGDVGYGILAASLEAGAFLMWILLMILPPIQRLGRALIVAIAVFGVATIVFGLSRSFPFSVAAYMVVGMADYVSVVIRGITIQLQTPDELRGRVSSVNMIFIGASNQLGAVESGFVAALTNATFAVVSGGAASLAALAIVAKRLPELRRYTLAASVAAYERAVKEAEDSLTDPRSS